MKKLYKIINKNRFFLLTTSILIFFVIISAIDEFNNGLNKDAFTEFFNIINLNYFSYIQVLIPILIILPALNYFQKELQSGFFKNILQRKKYSTYILKSILRAYKYALILPGVLLLILAITILVTKNLNVNETIVKHANMIYIDKEFMEILPIFLPVYFLNLFLHSIYWINLGLIFAKKSKNIFITGIEAFISFIAVGIILLVVINGFLINVFKITNFGYYFMLGIVWSYESVNLSLMILISLLYVIISCIVVLIIYHKKESVVIDNE